MSNDRFTKAPKASKRITAPVRNSPAVVGLRAEWRRLARRLADCDVELTAETAVAVVTTFDRLVRAGGRVEPMTSSLVTQLRLQLADAEGGVA